MTTTVLILFLACIAPHPGRAADDPAPSSASTLGASVFNPQTGQSTTVQALIRDPASTPTQGNVAFVQTADGYTFLVKTPGEIFYNADVPPVAFTVVSVAGGVARISAGGNEAEVAFGITNAEYAEQIAGEDTDTPDTVTPVIQGPDGVVQVSHGGNGSNGRSGALFVPPRSGGNGGAGPTRSESLNSDVNATSRSGWEIGSVGGNGGNGGNSYGSFWDGEKGGNGAVGGAVTATQGAASTIVTQGNAHHGIIAYSRSGKAGNGGSGYAAPGGGAGGLAADGGNVTVNQSGKIETSGNDSHGIFALSVGNNGGSGGSQWGLVGAAGGGGIGGSGARVEVKSFAGAEIHTRGNFSHGILAQSVGGSGGSAGFSGNLLVSLVGSGDGGGNGGVVSVSNGGAIQTDGTMSRGIMAQSVGGGGGAGGTAAGAVSLALGGAGNNGGSGSSVTVVNAATGTIVTKGDMSDGIMAQSIGGSGGRGANAYGLVALGGDGAKAGSGAAVSVSNFGRIETAGDRARGIIAQSIGGGGGDGGNSGGMVAVGGDGDGGGEGGAVTIVNDGVILTEGDEAMGLLAQSIGGGGGNGGSAGSIGAFASVGIGGAGGTGGAGGAVNVTLSDTDAANPSLIRTRGDRSTGVFAQSVGGGGGNGGGAVSVGVGAFGAASVAVGGSGGKGGAGGTVTLSGQGNAQVQTEGTDATGVMLQSVGGGGGNGGYAISAAVSGGPVSGSFSVAVGGSGGSGGAGGTVLAGSLDGSGALVSPGFSGSVLTTGDRSSGMIFQSVGGGGGNGGLAVAAAGGGSLAFSGSVSVGVGGSGGLGGAGGTVRVRTDGDVTTIGNSSTALLAQSVGGGGGNGGGSIAAGVSASGGVAATITAAVGGSGGGAGGGGLVELIAGGEQIKTEGQFSTGVLAQSVGGGGGNGGYSIGAGVAGAGGGAGAISVAVGASAGGGGDGGTLTADIGAGVWTRGDDSGAVLIQSVGGGGGNGGFAVAAGIAGAGAGSGAITVGLGGSGGTGGQGGRVVAAQGGDVLTEGDRAAGVVAQSIGGGGGNGGFAVSGALAGSGTGSGSIAVGLGGSGDAGGSGGAVTAAIGGDVTTMGTDSVAILAQSVGGGGGNGGFSVAGAMAGAGVGAGAVSVGLGGSGGTGATGGSVSLVSNGDVWTQGDRSSGVVAQSLGGGGGNGGFSVAAGAAGAGTGAGSVSVGLGGSGAGGGNAGNVTATSNGLILTQGDASAGFVAQSIGGGGGNGGFNVSAAVAGAGTGAGAVAVGLGGSGAGGGNGGSVTAITTGNIETQGTSSVGILAQSVGGGGGNGGFDVATTGAGAGTGAGAVSVGLGGAGAGGGNGGAVDLTVRNDVQTGGDHSAAVVAQSVGGGGGNGGFNVSAAGSGAGTGSGAVGVGIGGSAGTGGDGARVDSDVAGDMTTSGDSSTGVLVQSVGGGGGNGGMNVSGALSFAGTGSGAAAIGIGGSGGLGGSGGNVASIYSGTALTFGDSSGGVVAQSLGGGGGNGGINISGAISVGSDFSGAVGFGIGGFGGGGGGAGSADLVMSGVVQTSGNDSIGVLTQSLGGGGGNGALNVSGAVSISKGASGAVGLGVGGFGGSGADAGALASSSISGKVLTLGDRSAGVVTQSIGGGGGNGGANLTGALNLTRTSGGAAALGLGGFGGDGGNGGRVISTVTATGAGESITTVGADSIGVLAQSVGGGGGSGGLNVSGAVSLSGQSGAAVALGLGGFGGAGGDAGATSLSVTGDVNTYGNGSDGVVAQSVGGGGGSGGVNVSGSLALTKPQTSSTIFSVSAGVGGFGGGGGTAGAVDLSYGGTVRAVPGTISGNDFTPNASGSASGLVAQSIGGGGGRGGVNVSAGVAISSKPGPTQGNSNSSSYAVLVGVGGFGGTGGDAGNVSVDVAAGSKIYAHGVSSSGILAQSVGGGGGTGGLNVSGGIVSDTSLIVGVGGMGGNAGQAADVSVAAVADIYVSTNPASVVDPTDASFEAKLRSVFGDSVFNDMANSAVDGVEGLIQDKGLKNLFVDLGLFKGEEGPETEGSAGILAQSIGGGGGNGGLNVSGGLALSKDGKIPSVTFGIGGFGGDANTSGNVSVDHTGTIEVAGNWKHGIFAQSVAGGGGNGGLNISGQLNWGSSDGSGGATDLSIVAGLGGHGGTGANAGDVEVISSGNISTSGYHARGVFAQSIGGGGGTGGINVTAVGTKDSSPIAIGIGGFGASGGDAGDVRVIRGTTDLAAGQIVTNGSGSHGIEASSIGGGGGDAGINAVLGFSKTTGAGEPGGATPDRKVPANTGVDASVIPNFNAVLDQLEGKTQTGSASGEKKSVNSAVIAVGGSAGNAGQGGQVEVVHFGDVATLGEASYGVFAQSIGGGGGNAAFNMGKIFETGDAKNNKGFGLAIGGGTGTGGTGGDVSVRNTGDIDTVGAGSHGIFAQSVGGGGGNTSFNSIGQGGEGGNIGIVIGRTGGTGGSAGDIYASSDGNVITRGDGAHALFAQSIGNGGGNSGTNSVSLSTPGEGDKAGQDFKLSVGLEGGEGGTAGDVVAVADGLLATGGDDAHGIFAQSVGGGGGTAGSAGGSAGTATSYSLNIGGTGGTGGTSGTVNVDSTAEIATQGDRSVGILAQSVGGAGGTGGAVNSGPGALAIAKATVKGSETGTTVSVNIGGSGGEGMTSGDVTVISENIITTLGSSSHGIQAQSIGGGGGKGGLVENKIVNLKSNIATTATFSLGGSGGSGAVSGAVSVTNLSDIGTQGDRSAGIFAQAIGGGGGDAQHVRNIIAGAAADNSSRSALLIGGTGGTGAQGGSVTVANGASARIVTDGTESHGIFAQSIGGGGGNGSDVLSISKGDAASGAKMSQSIQLGLGGSGGTGGAGGAVDVVNEGLIVTRGDRAHGILAQSIGGGGGNGGYSITGNASLSPGSESDPTLALNMGGAGGSGNAGGNVTVSNSGEIHVSGADSYGVLAQSVGGGGGNGGVAIALSLQDIGGQASGKSYTKLALGGAGGAGADGGDVSVTHEGTIVVSGDRAYGIFAQSVGGGGGNAGFSISAPAVMVADYVTSTLLGARSGSEGKAGTVTVTSKGDILVTGTGSKAIFAQSVNGGGGNVDTFLDFASAEGEQDARANMVARAALPGDPGTGMIYAATLGGADLQGSAGEAVEQSHEGDITVTADRSVGLIVQSIGGGGGTQAIALNSTGSPSDLTVAGHLGATNTGESSGGTVIANRTGQLVSGGDFSPGGIVQSIGGGGGRFAVAASGNAGARSASFSLGAVGTSLGNHGNTVTLALNGDILTFGDNSSGQIIQSIGGGGGEVQVTGLDAARVALGASDGSSGNGGAISVVNAGYTETQGARSHGFLLQSIGGGGGLVTTDLASAALTVDLSSGNSGSGGDVTFTNSGHILAIGTESVGVLAQSIGGGGGMVDGVFRGSAGGTGQGGRINLDLTGNIMALGRNGIAVFAQSAGSQGGDDITLNLDGVIIGGGNADEEDAPAAGTGPETAAIVLDGGASNTVTLSADTFLMGLNNRVLAGGDGNDQVLSFGAVVGNIDLGTGLNGFTLAQGGELYAQDEIALGEAGLLMIEGDLFLGGQAYLHDGTFGIGRAAADFRVTNLVSQTTVVTGSAVFASTATYTPDVFFRQDLAYGGESDLIVVSADATMGGTIFPVLRILERAGPLVIVNAGGATFDSGTTVIGTPVLTYSIGLNGPTGDGSTIDLLVEADYRMSGMNGNQRRTAGHFNRILAGEGSAAMGPMFTLLATTADEAAIIDAIDRLGSEDYAATQVDALHSALTFADSVMNCDHPLGSGAGILENGCYWMRGTGRWMERDQSFESRRFETESNGFGGGVRVPLGADLQLGIAVEQESFRMTNGDRFAASGDRLAIGAALMREVGAWDMYGVLSTSNARYDSTRGIGVSGELVDGTPVVAGVAFARQRVGTANLRLGGSYRHDFEDSDIYLSPGLDFDATYLRAQGTSETGSDYALVLRDTNQWVLSLTPSLELGIDRKTASGSQIRAFARGEVSVSNTDALYVNATFPGASDLDGTFRNYSEISNLRGRLKLGVSVHNAEGTGFFNLGYQAEVGEGIEGRAASLGFGMKF
ncbi:hypothetical protein GVY41_17445 [Frigidibacter albus]|uniref:Autotransporter domain-containing protein n=1 Tax=Frigidibacter albus TaxID=1465486 RepID=A0A6L8VLG6_9RHOB|nr:autotransporter outer membrane beta-barrel domain-containing protein [Frigidibacter albus]MZQ90904.1 hypothetical protein [Frigidibacter albus]NBE32789.1 hypothetical protein [Frigidibacter albus]